MQSYRLLAAIPLNENDQKLVADMTATVFSPELQNSARRDGQEIQLKALQQYWQLALAPGMQRAVNQAEVAQDVADFVDRIDQLVTAFDHTTEQRIERVVWIHRILAIGMALLLTIVFTNVFLTRSLFRHISEPLELLVAGVERVEHGDLDTPIAYTGADDYIENRFPPAYWSRGSKRICRSTAGSNRSRPSP